MQKALKVAKCLLLVIQVLSFGFCGLGYLTLDIDGKRGPLLPSNNEMMFECYKFFPSGKN
jgi:hypothetical protein